MLEDFIMTFLPFTWKEMGMVRTVCLAYKGCDESKVKKYMEILEERLSGRGIVVKEKTDFYEFRFGDIWRGMGDDVSSGAAGGVIGGGGGGSGHGGK